jgi:phosphoglycerate dehydrogenase-like enzyme
MRRRRRVPIEPIPRRGRRGSRYPGYTPVRTELSFSFQRLAVWRELASFIVRYLFRRSSSLSAAMPSPASEGIILLDPYPRKLERIFDAATRQRLERLGRVIWHDGTPATDDHIERHLAETVAIIGQSALDKARLDRAPKLRAVFNVESNFLPNIDYAECHRRGIPVLSTAPVYARPVAEMVLGMAISLARRMHEADAAVRVGKEFKGDNHDSFLLHGKTLALVGFGNLGRALLPLLRPFSRDILIHDPWVQPAVLRELDVTPATLDDCFARARVVFLLAANTTENTGKIGAKHFALMAKGSVVILASRAALVNFPELLEAARSGHIRAGIDVWPIEPIPADEPGRTTPNTLLQAHRCGSVPEIQPLIGQLVADDLEAILAGLPPQRCQRAVLETVSKLRSIPVGAWSLSETKRP